MIAASAARTVSDVTTLSSRPANATAARVPTAYSAVFMPASPPNRRNSFRNILLLTFGLLRSKDVAEHRGDHRHDAGEQEGGQETQPERQHDEHAQPLGAGLGPRRPGRPQVVGEAGQRP